MTDVRGHAWVQRSLLVVAVVARLCGMHVLAATVSQYHVVAGETAPVVSAVDHGWASWSYGAAASTTTTPAPADHGRHGAMGGCALFLGASTALLVVLLACAAARALRTSYGVAPCWPRTSMLITPRRRPPAWRWPRSLCVVRVQADPVVPGRPRPASLGHADTSVTTQGSPPHLHTPTRIGALGAATALVVVLAACGSNDAGSTGSSPASSSTTSSSTPSSASPPASVDAAHNDQDVVFAQQMIVHHESAVDMAEMAGTRASSQQVKDLAAEIKAAQGPEIETMTSWLKAWGEPVAATDSSMSGMDGSSSMPGMMSREQTSGLDTATGVASDTMFLQLMTVHHQGAVEMATTEQAEGSNAQAIALAGEIESSQSAEVDQMKQMITTLG